MVLDIIKKTLREYNLLNNGDSVLVGLSEIGRAHV